MNTKKTKFVWFILISAIFEIIVWLYVILKSITNLTPYIIIDAFGVIILGIFVYKLYYLKGNILRWINIAFGYSLFSFLFNSVIGIVSTVRLELANLPPELLEEVEAISRELEVSKEAAFELFKKAIIIPSVATFVSVLLLHIIIWILFYKHLKKLRENSSIEFPSSNSGSLK